jgi:hypothetical protein
MNILRTILSVGFFAVLVLVSGVHAEQVMRTGITKENIKLEPGRFFISYDENEAGQRARATQRRI